MNNLLIEIFFISLGIIFGASTRFFIISRFYFFNIIKPLKILLVNLFSSFILGLFFPILNNQKLISDQKLLSVFLIGFLGSLSTFSSFIYNIFELSLNKEFKKLLILILTSLLFCIFVFYLGFLLSIFLYEN
tara:strand:+ start:11484 stop:11879 length:396 start_codon:yes stop_codon:yes gene_type:complete